MDDVTTPVMTITLPPIREMLPKIREAYDNKTLHMFNPTGSSPMYSGPCALGVCMTPEQQAYGDVNEFNVYALDSLVQYGIIKDLPESEYNDLLKLQELHDNAYEERRYAPEDSTSRIASFEEFLSKLEKKYAD